MMKILGEQLKKLYDDHFNKLLLAVLYMGTTGLCIHLMHKADAGGDDSGFIIWAENQAAFILGCLLGMMPKDKVASAKDPALAETKELEKQP